MNPPRMYDKILKDVISEQGDRCAWCQATEGATGYYKKNGGFRELSQADRPLCLRTMQDFLGSSARLEKVRLGLAQKDRDEANWERENLMALCRQCRIEFYVKGGER